MEISKQLETYDKAIVEANKKSYDKILGEQKKLFELTKIKFDKKEIDTEEYLKKLEESTTNFEQIIINCGDKAQEALEQFKLGHLTEQMIKDISDSLKKEAPELENSFNTAIKAILDNDKIIKELEKNQLKETLEKKFKAAENVVKNFGKIGISFKDSYSIINDAIAEVENQLANTLENDIETRAKYNEQIAKLNEQKREIEEQDITKTAFWANQMTTILQSFADGFGQALAAGFGKEDFKKLSQNLFERFKSILIQTLDFIEKQYILGTAKSLIEAVLAPCKVAIPYEYDLRILR
jgi:hypothetical protein